jgi:hypothetical protein
MLLTLVLTILTPLQLPVPGASPAAASTADEAAYELLLEEYEDANEVWREELRATKGLNERKEVRGRRPALQFRQRFEALADGGSGHSLLWLLENAKVLEKRKQVAAFKLQCYERLWSSHLDAEWFGDVIAMYTKERRDVSAETIEAMLASALERTEGDAHARVLLGLARYRLAGKCNSGLDFYKQLIKEHPESSSAKTAQREYDRLTKFGLGAAPPDFKGETIDGDEISLYANRGKITVVDFWGYW